MKVAIIKYNAGNIRSVLNALGRIGVDANLTDDPSEIRSAERVIFPGVGEASTAMNYLRNRGLDEVIKGLHQPVLGICLGMQLLAEYSEENETNCLGIIPSEVKKMPEMIVDGERIKIPHMGWNEIQMADNQLFGNIPVKPHFYFVHSYAMEVNEYTIASTEHGMTFSSGVQFKNFYGMQCHPEKSAEVGEQLLRNFLNIKV